MCIAVLAAAAAGCDSRDHELAPVHGKVIYRGKPLSFGTVFFQPDSGQPAVGAIQADGTFTMKAGDRGNGAAVGMNRVRVSCHDNPPPAKDLAPGFELPAGKSLIPRKYLSYDTSGLTFNVAPSGGEYIIQLD